MEPVNSDAKYSAHGTRTPRRESPLLDGGASRTVRVDEKTPPGGNKPQNTYKYVYSQVPSLYGCPWRDHEDAMTAARNPRQKYVFCRYATRPAAGRTRSFLYGADRPMGCDDVSRIRGVRATFGCPAGSERENGPVDTSGHDRRLAGRSFATSDWREPDGRCRPVSTTRPRQSSRRRRKHRRERQYRGGLKYFPPMDPMQRKNRRLAMAV